MSRCSEAMSNPERIEGSEDREDIKLSFDPKLFLPEYTILTLCTLSGNLLILIALHKDSSLHSPSKLLLRSLLLTDLCVGLISQPLHVIYLMTLANKNWRICGIAEGLAHASSTVLCGESINILTAISVDRLLVLLLGLRYRQVVTLSRVRLFVIISWTVMLTFSLTYLWDKRVFFLWGCGWLFFCLSISTCCYSKMYLTLRHRRAQIQDQVHGNNSGTSRLNIGRYKKTVCSALWIHSALLVCYLPYTIATAVTASRGSSLSKIDAYVWHATGILVFFNSTLNPFLFCWKIREVRQVVKQTIRNIFCCSQ